MPAKLQVKIDIMVFKSKMMGYSSGVAGRFSAPYPCLEEQNTAIDTVASNNPNWEKQ